MQRFTPNLRPGYPDPCLSRAAAEVQHDEISVTGFDPGPGNQIPAGLVIGPALRTTQGPLTRAKHINVDGVQQLPIKRAQVGIDRLLRVSAKENRQPNLVSVKLAVVEQFR